MPQHIISLAMVAISRKNPDFSPVSVSCVFSFKKRRRRFDKSPFCPFSRRRQRRNQYEGLLYKIKPFFRKLLKNSPQIIMTVIVTKSQKLST